MARIFSVYRLICIASHTLTNADLHSNSGRVYLFDSEVQPEWVRAFGELSVQLIPSEEQGNVSRWSSILSRAANIQLVWIGTGDPQFRELDLTRDWEFRVNRIPGADALTNTVLLKSFLSSDKYVYTSFGRQFFHFPSEKAAWVRTARTNNALHNNHERKRRDKYFLTRYILRLEPQDGNQASRQLPWYLICDEEDLRKATGTAKGDAYEYELMEYTEPYLIDGHRFLTSFYVIITCLDPLRFYIYSDVHVRIAAEAYPLVLTAESPQSTYNVDKNYISSWDFPDLKEKLSQMESILEDRKLPCNVWDVLKQYLHIRGVDMFQLQEEIEDMIKVTILRTYAAMLDQLEIHQHTRPLKQYAKFGTDYDDKFFELFKFDVEIDYEGHPKLLQVHSNPTLSSDTNVAKEKEFFHRLAIDTLTLIGVHPKATPSFESLLKRLDSPYFCSTFCKDTQRAYDTACYRCTGWFSPSVAYNTLIFAHEFSRRGNFALLYPSIEKDFTKFRSRHMSEYDNALDRYVKSLFQAYSDDVEMISMEKVPICVSRRDCNDSGNCINGVCVCDARFAGNNCYQEISRSNAIQEQWSTTKERMVLQDERTVWVWNACIILVPILGALATACILKRSAHNNRRTRKLK